MATSEQPLLEVNNISKVYDGPETGLAILSDVSLSLQSGDSVAIVGPSGSGKSTLLNIIGTLDQPTAGTVVLGGRDLSGLSDDALATVRNRDIGFVFQLHHLLPQCTVMENVLVPTLPCRKDIDVDATCERALALLKRVGLGERIHHRPPQLSGGERQRAAVVRALVNAPSLLLADEPTGSLDARSAAELGNLLTELNREMGVALLVVTHSRELAARMSRCYELVGGALRAL